MQQRGMELYSREGFKNAWTWLCAVMPLWWSDL